ncbi:DUF1727 domain-containing protein [Candidatus Saccharibacteria bacterium]|jgi:UDP-N-acetylmuramyl tripeptide synthase|nr:DUF1727 domain-containing protein [Candidatus Saccharibacteria bacterium]MBP9489379.1 DUF1727 domain-containing protein [Candidatus Saccharibacteria bacterium]MBP9552405.1 DUF1727 domain-containing protein [Candidatus Saccharibacteria bacterium]
MRNRLSIILGKSVQKIARIRGGGSALPGLFIEKVSPDFIKNTLDKLPRGVVIVSGTNGKTTTTKMIVELLESQGLKVFTNKSGSNFVRGVAAALLENVNIKGKLDADIAVLELDEAHAVHFVKIIQPRYSLLLNVMRDQLDRFGEIDHTAKLLHEIGKYTTGVVVLNDDDDHLGDNEFSSDYKAKVKRFGASSEILKFFPNDSNLHDNENIAKAAKEVRDREVVLTSFSGQTADILWGETSHKVNLNISGIYNILNAAAAVALVREIIIHEQLEFNQDKLISCLENIRPAFGRGEVIEVEGVPVELVLVKNPGGFRLSLKSFSPKNYSTMIAINDNYADGRDMSWLWDVDFSSLKEDGVSVVSGVRAYDMALRLFHDDVKFEELNVKTDLTEALKLFLTQNNKPKRIFCTYTAMLKLRDELSKITDVERVL